MTITLAGKRAVVVGGSSGIGRAIAEAFGREGAQVVVTYRGNAEGAEEVCRRIRDAGPDGGGDAWPVHVDISCTEDIPRAFSTARERMGGVDIAVLVGARFHMAPLIESDDDTIRSIVATNVTAPYVFAREAVRAMVRDRTGGGGTILLVGTSQGHRPLAGTPLYAGTKSVLLSLAKSICLEHARDGVQALVLSPGVTLSAGNVEALASDEHRRAVEEQIPVGRVLLPEQFADIAVRLVSEESRYMTGTEILVDGGLLCAGPQV